MLAHSYLKESGSSGINRLVLAKESPAVEGCIITYLVHYSYYYELVILSDLISLEQIGV